MNNKFRLDTFPVIISMLSVGLLCLSVIYDFGYFKYLGFGFSEAPTTITDHIKSSLVWLPSIIVMCFFLFVFELLSRRVEQGMTEDELIKSSPNPKFTKWFRDSPKYLIIPVALLVPVGKYFGMEFPISAWGFSLVIIWFVIHNWFFGHPRILERSSSLFFFTSRWIPVITIFVGFQGAIAAESSIGTGAKKYQIELSSKRINVLLLRTFDRYLLVWHPENKIYEFIPKSSIVRFYMEKNLTKN